MIERLGAGSARAVVLTMDRPAAALRALRAVRGAWPSVPVLARARDESHAAELRRAGAADVVPEALESALRLGERLLVASGMPDETATHCVDRERARREAAWSVQQTEERAP